MSRHNAGPPFVARVRAWATLGFGVACLYVLYVVLLYLIRGSQPFQRAGVSLSALVVAYLCSGTTAGALIGVLLPLARHWAGLLLVSVVAAFSVVIGVGISMYGFITQWTESTWLTTVISALLLGGMMTAVILSGMGTPRPSSKRPTP